MNSREEKHAKSSGASDDALHVLTNALMAHAFFCRLDATDCRSIPRVAMHVHEDVFSEGLHLHRPARGRFWRRGERQLSLATG